MEDEARAAFERAIANGGLPATRVRVLDADVSDDGNAALVLALLDTSPWVSFCERYDDGWSEIVTTEAGDAGTNPLGDRWVAFASGEAPSGAATVEIEHGGVTKQRAVVEGCWVAAFWLAHNPPDLPRVVAFG